MCCVVRGRLLRKLKESKGKKIKRVVCTTVRLCRAVQIMSLDASGRHVAGSLLPTPARKGAFVGTANTQSQRFLLGHSDSASEVPLPEMYLQILVGCEPGLHVTHLVCGVLCCAGAHTLTSVLTGGRRMHHSSSGEADRRLTGAALASTTPFRALAARVVARLHSFPERLRLCVAACIHSLMCVAAVLPTGALVDSDQGEDASESDEDMGEWAEDPMVAQLSTLRCANGSLCLSASVTVSCKPHSCGRAAACGRGSMSKNMC